MKKFLQKSVVLSLVLLAVIISLSLFIYKMNQKEDVGEVAVVVVDNGEKNIVKDEGIDMVEDKEKNVEINILDRYYDGRMGEWPMDAVDQIEVSDGFVLVTSLISHKGDKVVYYETDGENANVVILDLESKEKVAMEDTVKLGGCVGFEYLPSRWSVNDKKIIREWVHVGDGGCSASVPWVYIIDVDSLEEEVFMNHHSYIILEDDKRIVYFTDSNTYCRAMGDIFDGIIVENIETGEKTKIVKGENEIFNSLQMNEDHEVVYTFMEVIREKSSGGCYTTEVVGNLTNEDYLKKKVLELE